MSAYIRETDSPFGVPLSEQMMSSPLMLTQIHVARRSQTSASSMPFTAFATIVSYLIAAIQLAWGMTTVVDLGYVSLSPARAV